MFKIFYSKNRKKEDIPSIFEELRNSKKDMDYSLKFIENYTMPGFGEYEYNILEGKEKIEKKDAKVLLPLLESLRSDDGVVKKIDEFFKDKRAIEYINSFSYYYFMDEESDGNSLLYLAIKLMKLGKNVETVKFGILLCSYFDLESKKEAIKVVYELGEFPDFTYYSLNVLRPTDMYYGALENYRNYTFDYGELIVKIMEDKNEIR